MPRTFNTKKRRRGTAWRATDGDTPTLFASAVPPPATPGSSGRPRDNNTTSNGTVTAVDPVFDFPDDSQSSFPVIQSRKNCATFQSTTLEKSPFPKADTKAALEKASEQACQQQQEKRDETLTSIRALEAKVEALKQALKDQENAKAALEQTSEHGCPQHQQQERDETRASIQALEAKVEALQQGLKDQQTQLVEKDAQIKNLERHLDEARKERDGLKDDEIDKLQKQLAERNEAMEESAKATASRFKTLEDTITNERAEANKLAERVKSEQERATKLLDAVETQRKMMSTLMDRLTSLETQHQALETRMQNQNWTATTDRRRMKRELRSMSEIMTSKDARIHELEKYIESSTEDAKQLKILLSQLNRTFGVPEVPAKKRKVEVSRRQSEEPQIRYERQKQSCSQEGVSAWLDNFKM